MSLALVLIGIIALGGWLVYRQALSPLVACLLVLLIGVTFGAPFFKVNLGPIPVTIDRVLWGTLMLTLGICWLRGALEPKPLNRTDLIVLGMASLLITSTFLHDWSYQEKMPLSRLLFFQLLPMGFYFATRHCRITASELSMAWVVLTSFGIYLSLTAILEQREIYSLVYPQYILSPEYGEFLGRARGPFLNPVSCGIGLIICGTAATFLWMDWKGPIRIPLSGIIAACLVAVGLTLTRSVWLACILAIGVTLWVPAKPQMRGVMVVTLTLLAVIASMSVSANQLNRFKRDKDVSEAAMSESAILRPLLAQVAVKMAQDKPIFGHGFGQYSAAKRPYHYNQTNGKPLTRVLPYVQHNVFLAYLTELGMTGLLLLTSLIGILSFKSWSLWRDTKLEKQVRQMGLLALIFVMTFTINGMFHDVSIISHLGSLFFLMLGTTDNLYTTRIAIQQQPKSNAPIPTSELQRAA